MEAWADRAAKRDNRWSSARCARWLFNKEVLSSSKRVKHDFLDHERSILIFYLGATRYSTIDYCVQAVSSDSETANPHSEDVNSWQQLLYLLCHRHSFLSNQKLSSCRLLFCPTIIAVVAWQLQPLRHLNELRLRWWRCPWLHAGGSPTILKYVLG